MFSWKISEIHDITIIYTFGSENDTLALSGNQVLLRWFFSLQTRNLHFFCGNQVLLRWILSLQSFLLRFFVVAVETFIRKTFYYILANSTFLFFFISRPLENGTHMADHQLIPLYEMSHEAAVDDSYTTFEQKKFKYNYLDPNFVPG